MSLPLYIYDPTASDVLSKVRGIGRYMQILHETMEGAATFQSDLQKIPFESVLLDSFFNFLQKPITIRRVSRYQVAVIHDLIPLKYPLHFPIGWKGTIHVLINKWTLGHYDHIITNSETTKHDVVRLLHIDETRVTAILPTAPRIFWTQVNANLALANSYQLIANGYCLYVGDATWNKNLVNLAQAIKIADIPCVFAGKVFTQPPADHPWQRDYHAFRELAAGDSRFIFPGYVADEDLVALYKNALCNILPSFDEGFGFSYLEASILGIPSILSDIETFHEVAQDAAVFVAPDDPQAIAGAITALKTDSHRRAAVATAARTRSIHFAPDTFRDALHRCIEALAPSSA